MAKRGLMQATNLVSYFRNVDPAFILSLEVDINSVLISVNHSIITLIISRSRGTYDYPATSN